MTREDVLEYSTARTWVEAKEFPVGPKKPGQAGFFASALDTDGTAADNVREACDKRGIGYANHLGGGRFARGPAGDRPASGQRKRSRLGPRVRREWARSTRPHERRRPPSGV